MKTTLLIFLTAVLALVQIVHVHGVQICGYPDINCRGAALCCANVNPLTHQCCNFGRTRRSVKWFFRNCGSCVGASWPRTDCYGRNLGGVGGNGDFCKTFFGPYPTSANAYDIVHRKVSNLEWAYINGTVTKPASTAASCLDADQAFYDKDGVRTWITIPQGQLHHVATLLENKNYTALHMLVGN